MSLWSLKNISIFISFITIAAVLIMLIIYRNALNTYFIYISTVANVVVILLMLITIISTDEDTKKHIESLEDSTMKQIQSWEKWDNIQRKQFLKSIIKELYLNIDVYNSVSNKLKQEQYNAAFNNFVLISLERSLHNSPVDDKDINQNLLVLYYALKIHYNKIESTRIPNLTEESVKGLIEAIVKDYSSFKVVISETIKMLEEYDKKIKV
jgi:hypothetical protein